MGFIKGMAVGNLYNDRIAFFNKLLLSINRRKENFC
jgi:hypothetical protein